MTQDLEVVKEKEPNVNKQEKKLFKPSAIKIKTKQEAYRNLLIK
jgi:hypothetical protein